MMAMIDKKLTKNSKFWLPWIRIAPVLCASFFLSCASAEEMTAEDKLESVKQSLVDLAMKSNLQLGSFAYIDSTGALHESSVISSDADIRGVRILSYLQDAGVEAVNVEAEVFSAPSCPGSRSKIRRQALVRATSDVSSLQKETRHGDHYLGELLATSKSTLLKALQGSKDWLVSSETDYPTTYDFYMSSQTQDRAPYRFDITIGARDIAGGSLKGMLATGWETTFDFSAWAVGKVPELNYNKPWPSHELLYQVALVNRQDNSTLWRAAFPVKYPRVERGYGKSALPQSVKDSIVLINSQIISNATSAIDCHTDSHRLAVVPGRLDKFKIAAGSSAGVKVGDQFLIGDSDKILTQSLNMASLAGLGLAEVESVTNRTATLKYLAGPKPEGMGGISKSMALHF
jgi:hypothetical protein